MWAQGARGPKDKEMRKEASAGRGGTEGRTLPESTRPCGRSGVGAAADRAGRLDFTWMMAK